MKKSDLENGMVAEINGELYFLINDVFVGMEGYMPLELYSEELKEGNSDYNVTKVFEVTCWGSGFNYIVNNKEERLRLIWEEEPEIDWSKVPEGTIAKFRDHEDCEWEECEFLTYLGDRVSEENYGFIVYQGNGDDWSARRYATIDNPKKEWLI